MEEEEGEGREQQQLGCGREGRVRGAAGRVLGCGVWGLGVLFFVLRFFVLGFVCFAPGQQRGQSHDRPRPCCTRDDAGCECRRGSDGGGRGGFGIRSRELEFFREHLRVEGGEVGWEGVLVGV